MDDGKISLTFLFPNAAVQLNTNCDPQLTQRWDKRRQYFNILDISIVTEVTPDLVFVLQ